MEGVRPTAYSTDDYDLVVGITEEDKYAYQLVNRETGVMEYEDYLLPRAVDYMIEVQSRLEAVRAKLSTSPVLTLIGETKDGADTTH